jgi:hypothetical protein
MLGANETVTWRFRGDGETENKRRECWDVCGGHLKLGFIRNDWLTVSSSDTDACNSARSGRRRSAICEPWALRGLLSDFSVFVVNSGAHSVNESSYEGHVKKAATFLAAEAPPSSLLFHRDTVPGHAGCENFAHAPPLHSTSEAEAYLQAHPWYDGDTFKEKNVVSSRVFEEAGFVHLATYAPTIRRLDSHIGARDCLHYCIPGPSVAWCEMLFLGIENGG